MLHENCNRKYLVGNKNPGRGSRGACRQEELIEGNSHSESLYS
jgi:hypothetical protein